MRISLKIALLFLIWFLIWPISAIAQDTPPSSQADPFGPSLAGAGQSVPPSHPTTDSDDVAVRTPALGQAPAFLPVRPARQSTQSPVAPGFASAFSLSAGYSVTALGVPALGRVAAIGTEVALSVDTGRRLGAELIFGYASAANVFSSGHRLDEFNYQVGPVFHFWNKGLLSTYAHLMAGGARVAGPFPGANGAWNIGYVNRPAFAGGGGVEYPFSDRLGLRIDVDYMRTNFFTYSGAIRGQNGLRVVNSLVYYFGTPPIRRRR